MRPYNLSPADPIPWLKQVFTAAVHAVQPSQCLPARLPKSPHGRTLVLGAGKAAAAMAQSVEAHWHAPLSGLVVTRYGHDRPCQHIETVEAAHPVPDQLGMAAAGRMLTAAHGLERADLMLALISGGGSSLLALPAPGITLTDKQTLSQALLNSGAPIDQINTVRSHLSAIKGGRLAAAAAPARVASLIISDVPDNNPAWVASGPTVPNRTSATDALAILDDYAIPVPQSVRIFLNRSQPIHNAMPSSGNTVSIIATAADALSAAHHYAKQAGINIRILGDALTGEARELGHMHGRLVKQLQSDGLERPILLLSGGETSVTVKHSGRGGRNTEYLLSLALEIDGVDGIYALAADTDGIDGSQDNAGAILRPNSLKRARAVGMDAPACLTRHCSYDFFAGIDDLLVTGPTYTNVNDFRAILVQP